MKGSKKVIKWFCLWGVCNSMREAFPNSIQMQRTFIECLLCARHHAMDIQTNCLIHPHKRLKVGFLSLPMKWESVLLLFVCLVFFSSKPHRIAWLFTAPRKKFHSEDGHFAASQHARLPKHIVLDAPGIFLSSRFYETVSTESSLAVIFFNLVLLYFLSDGVITLTRWESEK